VIIGRQAGKGDDIDRFGQRPFDDIPIFQGFDINVASMPVGLEHG
jgi:hypothetical protein